MNDDPQKELKKLRARRWRWVLLFLILFILFAAVIAFVTFIIFPIVRVFAAEPSIPSMRSGSVMVNIPSPSGTIVTEPIILPFAASGFGFRMTGDFPSGADVHVFLRTVAIDGTYSPWQGGDVIEDDEKSEGEGVRTIGPLFVAPTDHIQISLELIVGDDGLTPVLTHLELFYFGEPETVVHAAGGPDFRAQSSSFRIIPRAEWGADDSWRFCKKWDSAKGTCAETATDPIWPAEIVPVKKFIIHHTAGSTGGSDPAATVRALYFWHAISLGWGDVGYNYLIDPLGNIYEGRYGGDGVVGGHSFYDTCVELGGSATKCTVADGDATVGYQENSGSVGIALLGNYESRDEVTQEAKAALEWLIGEKATTAGIDPQGKGAWTFLVTVKTNNSLSTVQLADVLERSTTLLKSRGITYSFNTQDPANVTVTLSNLPNLLGHRDVDATLCPGAKLYAALAEISPTLGASVIPDYRAEPKGAPSFPVALFQGKSASGTVVFKNTGVQPWIRGEITLNVTDANEAESPFWDPSWPTRLAKITFHEEAVQPGETATFTVPIVAPVQPKTYLLRFHLFRQKNSSESEEVVGGVVERFLRVDAPQRATRLYDNWRPALRRGWTPLVTVVVKNTGITSWRRSDTVLELRDLSGGASPFTNNRWNGGTGLGVLREDVVRPGQVGTFVIRLKAPRTTGVYPVALHLKQNNTPIWIGDSSRMVHLVRVDL